MAFQQHSPNQLRVLLIVRVLLVTVKLPLPHHGRERASYEPPHRLSAAGLMLLGAWCSQWPSVSIKYSAKLVPSLFEYNSKHAVGVYGVHNTAVLQQCWSYELVAKTEPQKVDFDPWDITATASREVEGQECDTLETRSTDRRAVICMQ